MSTKTNTNTQNSYNAAGMSAYNSMIPQLQGNLQAMASAPLNNSMFGNQLAQSQQSASQIGQRNMSNIAANTRAGGGLLSGAGGFTSAMQNNAMLSNSSNQSGAFNSSLNSALSNRNFAMQGMEGFNPLQTGSTTQQTKSGLGTWLPQVAGAALGAATGGLSSMAGSAVSSVMNGAPNTLPTQSSIAPNMTNPLGSSPMPNLPAYNAPQVNNGTQSWGY